MPVGSDPGGDAAGPGEATEAAGDDERGADDLTEEDVMAGCWRIAEALGLGPASPVDDVVDEAAEVPGPAPAGPEPRPSADPGRGPAGPSEVAAVRGEIPGSSEQGPRHPAIASDRPAASTLRVAVAVLALFAPLLFAGLPAAAARSSPDRPATNPSRPMDRGLARAPGRAPTPAGWLCSSRAPGAAIGEGERGASAPCPINPTGG
jgi:hypothetical protein